jgi:hypothetical protein
VIEFCLRVQVQPTQFSPIRAGPDTGNRFVDWTEMSRFHLKTEIESNLGNFEFKIKDRTMDNAHNYNCYNNKSLEELCHSIRYFRIRPH